MKCFLVVPLSGVIIALKKSAREARSITGVPVIPKGSILPLHIRSPADTGSPTLRFQIMLPSRASEANNVYALDALDGSIIWKRNVGDPVSAGDLICNGNIDPFGITGTPVIDLASRALFFNAMITPDNGTTKKHFIFSLNVDTGEINPGWPVDVGEVAIYDGTTFTPSTQAQRPALGLVDNIVYVPYGSFLDHCTYHGWLVGVRIDNPAGVMAWATDAMGGAIWGVGGVASDGKNPFVVTGNTINTGGNWGGGEAVIRFQPGPIFAGDPSDYFAPLNWLDLDTWDFDLGGCGPLLVD